MELYHMLRTVENSPDLLTMEEGAAMLRIKLSTIRAWRNDGRHLGFVKIGRKVCVRRQDVEALIATNYEPAGTTRKTKRRNDNA